MTDFGVDQKRSLREQRNYLRKFRRQMGLNLKEVANRSGLSESMVSKFELGQRDLSVEALGRLQDALISIITEELRKSIAPTDPDYQSYKKFLSNCAPENRKTIKEIIGVSKDDLELRELSVEMLRQLSEANPTNPILNEWFEAERLALLAFKKVRNLDARFDLEVGILLAGNVTGMAIRKKREIVQSLKKLGIMTEDMGSETLDALNAGRARGDKSNG